MTATGFLHRLRSRRVAIVAAGVGAAAVAGATVAVPAETVATWADDVWSGAGFTAGKFSIQSSGAYNGGAAQHDAANPFVLEGSPDPGTVQGSTPLNLLPGAVSYASVFLSTRSDTASAATVTTQAPIKRGTQNDDALWNTYVTFGARAVEADSSTTCNEAVFTGNQGTLLFANGTKFESSPAGANSFTLAANGGSQTMVCFRFTLATNVVTGSPSSNGKSVNPLWIFDGVSS